MKLLLSSLFLVSSLAFAQLDLSTPGGAGVWVDVASVPSGAEVYVASTFIGLTPTRVRINTNTDTPYWVRVPGGGYQDHRGVLNLAGDDAINVWLEPAGASNESATGGEPAG